MNIKDIIIKDYPVIIFSDSHCNIQNISRLQELYPQKTLISLGDFCFLFAKEGEPYNNLSIQYFIDNNIPALEGNHESFLVASENKDRFVTQRVLGKPPEFNLSKEHLQFLENLPRVFKLILPNGYNYYCSHNLPKDLWSFPDKITPEYFRSNYIFDEKSLGIIQGHLHLNKIDNLTPKRYVVGQLCKSDHHRDKNKKGGNYLLLGENGIEYKAL